MDIDILLALQGLRQSLGGAWETLFYLVTCIPVGPLTYAIPVLLYYWFDKAAGQYVLFSFGLGSSFNSLVKNIACVYRPWVRDERIHPAEAAIPGATGYSFPSGHTQTMGSVWVGWGWRYRSRHRWLLVLCSVLTVLVGFSRCFLGVHTPQDVLVGLGISLVTLWAAGRLLTWAGEGRSHDVHVLVALLAYVAVAVAFLALKDYPLDYADGALVVDPEVMVLDAYRSFGMLGGLALGWFLERRYVNFSTSCERREKVVRLVCGLAFAGVTFLLCRLLKADFAAAYYLTSGFVPVLAAVWAGPAVAQRICAGGAAS